MEISFVKCFQCDENKAVTTSSEKIENWKMNRRNLPLIQDHFPELSKDERELILSGICGSCFNEMFPE